MDIQYRLRFTEDSVRQFELHIDEQTLQLIPAEVADYPPWAALDYHRCPNCPLDENVHPYCPAACSITEIVSASNDLFSYTRVNVEVQTPERTVSADTTLQRAVSSLFGLTLAVSGCPHTAFFKPMARFHLPLASEEETIYRVTSMYLLAQYFRHKQGEDADMDLSNLAEIYRNLQIVNKHMAGRLRGACDKDATVNAVVILDMLAKALSYTIDESLQEMRYLFESYLDGK